MLQKNFYSKYYLPIFGFIIVLSGILFFPVRLSFASQEEIVKMKVKTNYVENRPYISPTPAEFPIVASSPWFEGKPTSTDALAKVKECGFNAILSYTTLSYFNQVAPLLKKVGLKAIIGTPEFSSDKCIPIIDTLKNNTVIGAWRLVDEPREINFSDWQKINDKINEIDTTHMTYINLVGPEAKSYFLGACKNYEEFLDNFQATFRPGVWSYDVYPISVNRGRPVVNYPIFYEALEIYSLMSKITGRPFWAYCQSLAFSNKSLERPAATLSYLSFEAFSALGYGAKGLVYWTYCQRRSNERENYTSALVDLNGKKTSSWYAAQQVNKEIEALRDVFLNTVYVDTWHIGNGLSKQCKPWRSGTACLKAIEGKGVGFQISELKSEDSNYLIIINKDVVESQYLSLSFLDRYNIHRIEVTKSTMGYGLKKVPLNKTLKQTVPPGRYIILKYNKSN